MASSKNAVDRLQNASLHMNHYFSVILHKLKFAVTLFKNEDRTQTEEAGRLCKELTSRILPSVGIILFNAGVLSSMVSLVRISKKRFDWNCSMDIIKNGKK